MSMTYKVNVMILRDQAERRGIRSVEEDMNDLIG